MINNNKQFCFGIELGFEVSPTHPTSFPALIYSYVEWSSVTINQIRCGHCVGLIKNKKEKKKKLQHHRGPARSPVIFRNVSNLGSC